MFKIKMIRILCFLLRVQNNHQ